MKKDLLLFYTGFLLGVITTYTFFMLKPDKKPSKIKKPRNQLLMEPIGYENLQESDNSK
ncbi:hypothetical protein RIR_e55673_A0A2N1P322_9GLOM [Rhizophagus irregularis DAOM 181602=DAOM 197198]|uniref:Uncharacterized protein n=1 Tax=Rhizophagus irregularis TaxID=588596 RepID=A0A2N1P322_9GLOM|nr:hypothetical protein RhiirC2_767926 [Rhizophagus irregularis]GET64170.1 hypothetical protein RIR_e55673_A0A2N1P322_9GLOM [Rhizophagus irregularis DAOM 181602=DAOM 197198]